MHGQWVDFVPVPAHQSCPGQRAVKRFLSLFLHTVVALSVVCIWQFKYIHTYISHGAPISNSRTYFFSTFCHLLMVWKTFMYGSIAVVISSTSGDCVTWNLYSTSSLLIHVICSWTSASLFCTLRTSFTYC